MTAWISTADVIAYLPGSVDTPSADAIAEAATDAVRQHIERELARATYSEVYDSNGTDYVLLNNWPIVSISSVTINGGAALPPAGYNVRGYQLDPLVKRKLNFPGQRVARGVQNVAVTYVAGYDVTQAPGSATGLPASVWQALRLTAAAIYNSSAADPNLASESTGGVFSGSFTSQGVGSLPVGAITLLTRFRRTSA